MAKRTNWKLEFATLLANKRLVGRNRTFIESLHQHWSSGKAMTSGRKHHFFLVKERLAQLDASGTMGDATIEGRCERLMKRTPESSWDRGFVESVQGQNANGHRLSGRQAEILTKIEGRYSDEAIAAARGFADNYTVIERTRMVRMANYYHGTPYFRDLSDRVLTDPEFVPTKKQYDSMTKNKYANKVIAGYATPPAYDVGSTVQARAGTTPSTVRRALKVGGVVLSTEEAIKSACKGNRTYKVLPIGSVKPINVEERYIKVRR